MQITIDEGNLEILSVHLDDINSLATECDPAFVPLELTQERVERLLNGMVEQIHEEGTNLFEDYDEEV